MTLISSTKFAHKCCLASLLCFTLVILHHNLLNVTQFDSNIIDNYTSRYPYIALIVDDRANEKVLNSIFNILQHIPIDWKIQIITPIQYWSFYNSSSLSSMIISDRIFLTSLDFPRVDFTGSEYINLLLTSASFWHQVQGEKILYFQIDSVICSNSSYKLTDFLEYDFIGAPWPDGGCCNGGFSLRSRKKMLQLFENPRAHHYRLHETNEDVWLYRNLPHLNARIAPNHIAKQFSVESIYHPRPFAVHKPNFERLGSVNMKLLCNDCPEVKTISTHC